MGISMIANIVYYGMLIANLQKNKYFIAVTRYEVEKEVDFEAIVVNEIKYFLYRNETEGARDAGDGSTSYIESNIDHLCENNGYFLWSDPKQLGRTRDNIYSNFTLVSEGYILLLMTVVMLMVTVIIPSRMKEYHVPMLLREAGENMFHVMMKIRVYIYMFFITLSGCLC